MRVFYMFKTWIYEQFLWNSPEVNAILPRWLLVNIGSGDGLVSLGHKPLRKPILTKFYDAIWLKCVNKSFMITSPGLKQ